MFSNICDRIFMRNMELKTYPVIDMSNRNFTLNDTKQFAYLTVRLVADPTITSHPAPMVEPTGKTQSDSIITGPS